MYVNSCSANFHTNCLTETGAVFRKQLCLPMVVLYSCSGQVQSCVDTSRRGAAVSFTGDLCLWLHPLDNSCFL